MSSQKALELALDGELELIRKRGFDATVGLLPVLDAFAAAHEVPETAWDLLNHAISRIPRYADAAWRRKRPLSRNVGYGLSALLGLSKDNDDKGQEEDDTEINVRRKRAAKAHRFAYKNGEALRQNYVQNPADPTGADVAIERLYFGLLVAELLAIACEVGFVYPVSMEPAPSEPEPGSALTRPIEQTPLPAGQGPPIGPGPPRLWMIPRDAALNSPRPSPTFDRAVFSRRAPTTPVQTPRLASAGVLTREDARERLRRRDEMLQRNLVLVLVIAFALPVILVGPLGPVHDAFLHFLNPGPGSSGRHAVIAWVVGMWAYVGAVPITAYALAGPRIAWPIGWIGAGLFGLAWVQPITSLILRS